MDIEREKYYTPEASRAAQAVSGFMRRVYVWMMLGLVVTGCVAYLAVTSQTVMYALFVSHGMTPFIVLCVAELGIVFFLSAKVTSLAPATASALFFVYSGLNGLTIAPLLLIYTQESVAGAFFISAGLFGAMSVYGAVTKRDLTEFGDFLKMGLIGLVIAIVANMFIGGENMSMVISIMAVLIFTGLAAYDSFKWRGIAASSGQGDEVMQSVAVVAALEMYLDFINIFIHLLRIMGRRR
ncbi:MAG: Bax inhibitor-1/YccA family protein [Synergistaceae bacterium]|jgi:FtsH-binding integral membrane protein|nr:Bax inhibitor-1/YccA family protein [Synergistaceae bacterium]